MKIVGTRWAGLKTFLRKNQVGLLKSRSSTFFNRKNELLENGLKKANGPETFFQRMLGPERVRF